MVATTSKKVRFANNNQITDLDSGNITFSSELTTFPFSYAQDDARYRVWKPAGNFEITATNNLLYFNDGSDQTATITVGTYTYTTLATEVATRLNALSSGWSCSYGAFSKKFTIFNASSHELRFSEQTNAIWDTMGYISLFDTSVTSFEADEVRNHTSEYATFDLGAPKHVDFFAMIGPVGDNFSISTAATITLKGNSINDFSAPPISKTVTSSDNGVFYFEDTDDMNYRYWKIEFIDRENIVGPEGFNISNIYLGDYDTLTNTNISKGFQRVLSDPTQIQISDAGTKFFRERSKYFRYSSMGILNLTTEERLEMETFFQSHGTSRPFYIAIDPKQCVSNTLDEFTKFVHFEGDPVFDHVNAEYFNMGFALTEVR